MDKQLFGAFVAEQRKRQGLTQQQLAQALHVTDKAVSKWERGLSYPDVTLLHPLAAALHLAVDDLLTCRPGESEELLEHTTPTIPAASPAVQAVVDISHVNDVQQQTRRRRCAAAAILAVIVLTVLAVRQYNGGLFLRQRTVAPDGTFTLSVYRDGLFTGRYWLQSSTPLYVESHCTLCDQFSAHTVSRVQLPKHVTDVAQMRWSADGRRLLLYGKSGGGVSPAYLELWDFSAEPIRRQEPTVGILVQLSGYEDPAHPTAPLLPALPGVLDRTYVPRVTLSSPRWLSSGDLELSYTYTGTDGIHRAGTLVYDTAAGHIRSVSAP